jgi:hypothetical protein
MEDLGRTGPRLLVIRDSALQVDDAEVRSVQKGHHVAPRLLGTHVVVEGLGDPAPEHDVAGQRQGNHLEAGVKCFTLLPLPQALSSHRGPQVLGHTSCGSLKLLGDPAGVFSRRPEAR